MAGVAYQATAPCPACGSVACALQSPDGCRHGERLHFSRTGRLADSDGAACPRCGSSACATQSPTGCRHGNGGSRVPRPAPAAVVERADGVVQDITLTAGHSPVFRPTARGGTKGRKS